METDQLPTVFLITSILIQTLFNSLKPFIKCHLRDMCFHLYNKGIKSVNTWLPQVWVVWLHSASWVSPTRKKTKTFGISRLKKLSLQWGTWSLFSFTTTSVSLSACLFWISCGPSLFKLTQHFNNSIMSLQSKFHTDWLKYGDSHETQWEQNPRVGFWPPHGLRKCRNILNFFCFFDPNIVG